MVEKMDTKTKWLPAIIDTALGYVPIVGTALSNAFDIWRQKNITTAREVLLLNVRQGEVEALYQDELFSMLARFSRSVQEGVAKNNLILLARLISGIGCVDKADGRAETFNMYANMLETLNYDEIEFLSECIKAKKVVSGSDDLKQSLYQKGFFVLDWHSSISNKSNSSFVSPYSSSMPEFSIPHLWNDGIPSEFKPKPVPYEVSTTVIYNFSDKLINLLRKYGNLWEDISKWAGDKNAE